MEAQKSCHAAIVTPAAQPGVGVDFRARRGRVWLRPPEGSEPCKHCRVRPVIFTVRMEGPGALSTMARPRGGDWLADEMSALREAGVDVLVSMLSRQEMEKLGLAGEASAARTAGITFLSLSTPDRGLPRTHAFKGLVDEVVAAMDAGNHVVVHCRMGIGRSSMVAAAALMARGTSGPDVWAAIASARGLEVPDTEQQRQWVELIMRPAE